MHLASRKAFCPRAASAYVRQRRNNIQTSRHDSVGTADRTVLVRDGSYRTGGVLACVLVLRKEVDNRRNSVRCVDHVITVGRCCTLAKGSLRGDPSDHRYRTAAPDVGVVLYERGDGAAAERRDENLVRVLEVRRGEEV